MAASITAILNPYLWYDEAGQFWMSMGLNHYSAPFSERGGVVDVINNNRLYNMDPGGFSLLLFLWMHISTDIIFVRTLPYIFFFGTALFLAFICYRDTKNKMFSFFVLTLPFVMPYVVNKAGELRAYSMEMMGIVVGVLLLMRIKQRVSITRVLILGIVLSITCTTRYASIIASFAISLRLFYVLYTQCGFKKMFQYMLVYAIPLVLTVILVYIGMMRYQNSNAEEVSYVKYIYSSPQALIQPISIVYYFLIILCVLEKKRGMMISEISIIALCVGTTFFFFSIADKYPWDVIKVMPATILLSFGLIIEMYRLFGQRCKYTNIILVGILVVLSGGWIIGFDRLHRGDRIDKQMTEFKDIISKNNYSLFFVDLQYTPGVRYYFEYGKGKKDWAKVGYPDKFFLQYGPNHSRHDQNKKKIIHPNNVNADFYLLKFKGLPYNVKKQFARYKTYQYIYRRETNE